MEEKPLISNFNEADGDDKSETDRISDEHPYTGRTEYAEWLSIATRVDRFEIESALADGFDFAERYWLCAACHEANRLDWLECVECGLERNPSAEPATYAAWLRCQPFGDAAIKNGLESKEEAD